MFVATTGDGGVTITFNDRDENINQETKGKQGAGEDEGKILANKPHENVTGWWNCFAKILSAIDELLYSETFKLN